MLDRGSHKSAEELAHEQERFDIHVMAFAERSPRVVRALQRAFAIGAEAAQRLLDQTPVVVKRAAPPEVADALLDVLGQLGAQVVILPAPPAPSQPAAAAGPSDSPPAPIASTGSAWGGLDLELSQSPRSRVEASASASDDSDPFAPPHGAALSLPPESSPPYEAENPNDAGDREFDFDTDEDGGAGDSEEALSNEEALGSDPPGSSLEVDSLELPSALGGAGRKTLAMSKPLPSPADLGLGSLPPLPGVTAKARSMPPIPPARAVPPAHAVPPRPPTARAAAPRRVAAGVPSPPLPSLPPMPPPAAPLPAPRGTARAALKEAGHDSLAKPRGAQRVLESTRGLALPRLELDAAPVRRSPRPSPDPAQKRRDAEPTSRTRTQTAEPVQATLDPPPPVKAKPAAPPAPARSHGVALVELAAGAIVIYLGLRMGNTILHGDATWLSIVVHGFALYGIGAGVVGLRP